MTEPSPIRPRPPSRALAVLAAALWAVAPAHAAQHARPAPSARRRRAPRPPARRARPHRPARPRRRDRQRRGAHAVRRSTSRSASSLEQMKAQNVTPPAPDVAREAAARAADHRARAAAVREGNRRARRRHAGRAHDPAHRAGQQAHARRVPQGASSSEGIPYAKYREDIRNEIIIQRLREREVDGRVTVSDAEVDNFLATHGRAGRRRRRVPAVARPRGRARAGVARADRGEAARAPRRR